MLHGKLAGQLGPESNCREPESFWGLPMALPAVLGGSMDIPAWPGMVETLLPITNPTMNGQ